MPRVTADTNIYISALNFGGNPERLLRLAEAGVIQLIASDAILAEVVDVLRGEKFAWPEPEIDKALRQLRRITERVQPTRTLQIITDDPPDNRILECAEAGKAEYIVSGDRHLLRLKSFGAVPVLKVAEFLRLLKDQSSRQWVEAVTRSTGKASEDCFKARQAVKFARINANRVRWHFPGNAPENDSLSF